MYRSAATYAAPQKKIAMKILRRIIYAAAHSKSKKQIFDVNSSSASR
jgi:hypothetical protein